MIWIVLVTYLMILALGGALLWGAYQIRYQSRLTLIRSAGKPLPADDARAIAYSYALMCAVVGVTVLLLAVAIPVYRIRWGTWHFYLATIGGVAGVWYNLLLYRHCRRGGRTGTRGFTCG